MIGMTLESLTGGIGPPGSRIGAVGPSPRGGQLGVLRQPNEVGDAQAVIFPTWTSADVVRSSVTSEAAASRQRFIGIGRLETDSSGA
jgi:hypothetical protein